MVLQADHAAAGQSVFGSGLPFAARLAGEPVVGPGFEFEDLHAVEPMLDMAVVEDDARRVPLALRIEPHGRAVREVHGVIDAQALPLLELRRSVLLLPALLVDELVFGAGDVGYLEAGALDHVVEHAAVAAAREFPLPVEDEVFVLFSGDDIARKVAAVAVGLDAAVYDVPRLCERIPVEVFPLVEALPVEEQLPAVGDFLFGERVLPGGAGGDECDGEGRAAQRTEEVPECRTFHRWCSLGWLRCLPGPAGISDPASVTNLENLPRENK